MKKINTSPISGMQEFTPDVQVVFDRIKNTIDNTYRKHGFIKIETPMIDRCEILLAKAGGDTEKQIYKVVKTAEASEGADQALRFDHTVPLARYVVEHENVLSFPFKVCQIGRNFRGERAQKGRFREFYQCDADVVGRGELPLYYDADVIATALAALLALGLDTPVVARVSNRKILTGVIEGLNLQEKANAIYNIIDHAEKVPMEKTVAAFTEVGVTGEKQEKILRLIGLGGGRDEVVQELRGLGVTNEILETGIFEFEYVLKMLEAMGLGKNVRADMKIVRGLDYYTGTVFEFALPEYAEVGSVGGGGRYDNLAGYFTDLKLPGVGASIGLSRLFYVLSEKKLVEITGERPVDVAVVPITEAEVAAAEMVAEKLRADGKTVMVVVSDKRLGDKMKYAASVARQGIVIGETEAASGEYIIRDLR